MPATWARAKTGVSLRQGHGCLSTGSFCEHGGLAVRSMGSRKGSRGCPDELVGQFQPVICGLETHREKITKSQKISLRMQNRGI